MAEPNEPQIAPIGGTSQVEPTLEGASGPGQRNSGIGESNEHATEARPLGVDATSTLINVDQNNGSQRQRSTERGTNAEERGLESTPNVQESGNGPSTERIVNRYEVMQFFTLFTFSYETYQYMVLIVTYMACASFFANRRALSIVRSSLNSQTTLGTYTYMGKRIYCPTPFKSHHSLYNGMKLRWPFELVFLVIYSLSTFCSGFWGDRYNSWMFLTGGMGLTGLFTLLFGGGQFLHIRSFFFYLIVQVCLSIWQSTAWPSVVVVVRLWFRLENRMIINGIWNSHTSVGNIAGTYIASKLLAYGWGWSMVIPGLIILFVCLLMLIVFWAIRPENQPGAVNKDEQLQGLVEGQNRENRMSHHQGSTPDPRDFKSAMKAAWHIHEVPRFAWGLFFTNAVTTIFLYWLPFYMRDGKCLSMEASRRLSIYFDCGGVLGVTLAGVICFYWKGAHDHANRVAAGFLLIVIPFFGLYWKLGDHFSSIHINYLFMGFMGICLNAPNALITSVVSEEYSATAAGIIEGTGSLGTFAGLILTGLVSQHDYCSQTWILMAGSLSSVLCLTLVVRWWAREGTTVVIPAQ